MSYNAVRTDDHEDFHEDDIAYDSFPEPSDTSSPPPPVPVHQNHLEVARDFDGATATLRDVEPSSATSRLSSMLRSVASTNGGSYDVIEDDDYEEHEPGVVPLESGESRLHKIVSRSSSGGHAAASHYSQSQHSPSLEPEPLVRRSSMNVKVHHPVPDLQSLQGAYVGNVHRLEESAERLSMTSNIEDEIQKMKMDQKKRERQAAPRIDTDVVGNVDDEPPLRKFSSASLANSIIGVNNAARNGGYSPGGYVSSPKGSMRSGTWSAVSGRSRATSRPQTSRLSDVREPDAEGHHSNDSSNLLSPSMSSYVPPPPAHTAQQRGGLQSHASREHLPGQIPNQAGSLHSDRPMTSASNDTYRQATTLFTDFDGVHYHGRGSEPNSGISREASLRSNGNDENGEHSQVASQVGNPDGPGVFEQREGVYYPAPVPMMLNLPQRLSKLPSSEQRDKRRTRALEGMQASSSKSSLDVSAPGASDRSLNSNRKSGLPPQLRASVFFEQPPKPAAVAVKNSSAVATLDSILDASAFAPVSAFTDHPFVGDIGAAAYKKPKARKSMAALDDARKSRATRGQFRNSSMMDLKNLKVQTGVEDPEFAGRANRRSYLGFDDEDNQDDEAISPGADELVDSQDENEDEHHRSGGEDDESETSESEEEFGETQYAAPTTLMAELRIRQDQQKNRTRNAAARFPNGMHSTLLEMDAVVEQQKKSRRGKHVALAWEDPDVAAADDDEDVPLGLLYPDKAVRPGQRVVGLMEKRELEENEPLGLRRARLRGVSGLPPSQPSISMSMSRPGLPSQQSMSTSVSKSVHLPPVDVVSEDDEEPLAVRRARLQGKDTGSSDLKSTFASEVLSQFSSLKEDTSNAPTTAKATASKTPDPEETLGQRRRRLQAEAKDRMSQAQHMRSVSQTGLSDVLHVNPLPSTTTIANSNSTPSIQNRIPSYNSTYNLPNSYQAQQAQHHAMTMSSLPQPGMYSMPTPMSMGSFAPGNRMTYVNSQNGNVMPGNFGAAGAGGVPVWQPTAGLGSGYGNQMGQGMPMGMPMGMPIGAGGVMGAKMQAMSMGAGQRDMINRWRQSVLH